MTRDRFMERCADDAVARLTAPLPPEPKSAPKDPNKPYGYDVEVMFHNGTTKTFHWVGTESNARRKAMLKPLAWKILRTEPLTRDQWIRSYGDPKLRM